MNTFFTSDAHLFDNRFKQLFRPFDSTEQYIKTIRDNWNGVVGEKDVVYCVGDILYDESRMSILDTFNGKKHLIRGNHEKLNDSEYLKYFTSVQNNTVITMTSNDKAEKFYVNHYPTKDSLKMYNIVGHVHGAWKVQKNMINVSVDCWNYTPVSSSQIVRMVEAIENYYDEDVWAAYSEINTKYMYRGKNGSYSDN